jgi:hypothetical protein
MDTLHESTTAQDAVGKNTASYTFKGFEVGKGGRYYGGYDGGYGGSDGGYGGGYDGYSRDYAADTANLPRMGFRFLLAKDGQIGRHKELDSVLQLLDFLFVCRDSLL